MLSIIKKIGIKGFTFNYSFMQASFQSAHTLPATNHPNSTNDVEAGDIIPGMPNIRLMLILHMVYTKIFEYNRQD